MPSPIYERAVACLRNAGLFDASSERAAAKAVFGRWGTDGLTYTALHGGGLPLLSSDGAACLAYVEAAGTAVALGTPSGRPEALPGLLDGFAERCRARGLRPALCGVSQPLAGSLTGMGYRLAAVGDEAIVDPAAVDLRGKQWRETRVALNRARRKSLAFSWTPPPVRTERVLRELRQVSSMWLRRKRLPQLRLAVGGMDGLADPAVRAGVAWSPDGRAEGFVTWVPVPAREGWALELLRSRPDAMAGVCDYLVGSSLLAFQAEGCRYASLGGTPLANVAARQPPAARALLHALTAPARAFYDFEGLRHFKRKFNPEWQPLYLAYRGRGGLLRALLAVGRTCAPALSPALMAQAPLALVLGTLQR